MSTPDLEELARKGREVSVDRRARAARKRKHNERVATRVTGKNLDKALGFNNKRDALGAIVGVGGMVLGGILMSVIGPPAGYVIGGVVIVAAVVGTFWASVVLPKRARLEELEYLATLPFEFDLDGYLDQLGGERMQSIADVTVRFASPPPEGAKSTLPDAVVGAAGSGSATLHGQKLVIKSDKLKTYFMGTGNQTSRYSNHNVHQWFRRCSDGLIAIHGQYPIAQVEVDIHQ